MTNIDYPFRIDGRGRTATTGDADHIRDLIEQVLFTAPGERVNRPTFGSGLLRLVFAPNGDALASTTQLTIHGNLQQWLGGLIEVVDVAVDAVDAQLRVVVRYTIRATRETRIDVFTQAA
jgi:phage baseplate assembly protein W